MKMNPIGWWRAWFSFLLHNCDGENIKLWNCFLCFSSREISRDHRAVPSQQAAELLSREGSKSTNHAWSRHISFQVMWMLKEPKPTYKRAQHEKTNWKSFDSRQIQRINKNSPRRARSLRRVWVAQWLKYKFTFGRIKSQIREIAINVDDIG